VDFLQHAAIELRGGLVNAGCVDKDDLRGGKFFAFVRGHFNDAKDSVARGLRLGRDDGDLFASEGVEQGALAYVGTTEDGDKS